MTEFKIDIRLIDAKQAVDDRTVDYVPFGVKTLKLQVRKVADPPKKVWIRTKQFKRDQDPCAIFGYADDGDDLWAVWGAGDVMGFCAKYLEDKGTKKAVVLDDDEPHVVYLHLIHRPSDPTAHQLRDHELTIVAVTTDDDVADLAKKECGERQHRDRVVAERTFTLTVPAGAGDPLRPVWTWGPDASTIVLEGGNDVPHYVSRWWPPRQVHYQRVARPPRITLNYSRLTNDNEGTIQVWLGEAGGPPNLAEVTGHLTAPLHDLRWVLPELHRFYDDKLYVLRLWFFWTDEDISADDLLTFVPEEQKAKLRERATREAAELMKPKLLGVWPGWGQQYEIPDVERFDIVFDPDNLPVKYGCTDAHWKEFWFRVNAGQPCRCKIAAPKEALKVVLDHILKYLENLGEEAPQPITNPLEEGELVSQITGGRCYYDPASGQIMCVEEASPPKAPGLLGKNAPNVTNAKPVARGLSSDVLEG